MSERKLIRLDAEDRVRVLSNVPLFAGCDANQLQSIANASHLLAFEDGHVVVPEGEKGQGFYLVLSGTVRVVHGDAEIARLVPGEFFGEIALIEGTPRMASVVAEGPTVCLGILRTDFRALLVEQPRIALRILEAEAKRIGD